MQQASNLQNPHAIDQGGVFNLGGVFKQLLQTSSNGCHHQKGGDCEIKLSKCFDEDKLACKNEWIKIEDLSQAKIHWSRSTFQDLWIKVYEIFDLMLLVLKTIFNHAFTLLK